MKTLARRILLVGALSLLWAGAANAGTVAIAGTTDPVNHTATLSWSVVGGNLVITLENTSNDGTLTAFAFTVTDSVTGAITLFSVSGTDNDGGGWILIACTQPGVSGNECVVTGPNEFGGSVASGIALGATGTFTFTGTFADPASLADFFVRWQATGSDGEGSDKSPGFPEPGTLALLGMGLLGLAASRRRRKVIG